VSSDDVITRRGVDYVLFAGLLVEAHQRGLRSIRARMLQLPSPENGSWAICPASVTIGAGVFTALGDAHPGNAGQGDVATLLLLSQTRAKAHALCDALNLRLIPIEDLPGYQPDRLRVPDRPGGSRWA
jgi:hypothetical protein